MDIRSSGADFGTHRKSACLKHDKGLNFKAFSLIDVGLDIGPFGNISLSATYDLAVAMAPKKTGAMATVVL